MTMTMKIKKSKIEKVKKVLSISEMLKIRGGTDIDRDGIPK